MISMIDNWVTIEDEPVTVELIAVEEIKALDYSINIGDNGSETSDFDVDDSEKEQYKSTSGKHHPPCTYIERTHYLENVRLFMESIKFPTEDVIQLSKLQ